MKRFTITLVLAAGLMAIMGIPVAKAQQQTTPIVVTTSNSTGATLGIPRWKGYMSPINPDNFWLAYSNGGSSANNINFTTDGGATWSSNVMQCDFNGYLDMHVSVSGRGDDLYYVYPGSGGVNHLRKFNAPSQSNDDRDPLRNVPNTSNNHRTNVTVQDNGRVWVFSRLSGNPSQNVRYHYSDNDGANWTSGVAVATGIDGVRIGSMPYVGGNPALVVFHMGDSRGYEYYLWNGSSFEARPDHSIYAQNMGSIRVFTHNVINDTTLHLIFGYGNSMTHVWKNYNGGTGSWNQSTIENSTYTVSFDWYPISTVKGDDLYLFYCKKSSVDISSSDVYYMKWSQITQTWSTPRQISTDPATVANLDPNTCFQVPDNADYIPVFWRAANGSLQDIYFGSILQEADTIPPAKVDDLGASPGETQGSAILGWTASGDDAGSGAATRYIVKYSVSDINGSSWDNLDSVAGPSPPLAAGQLQSFTITGLTVAETYNFAVMAFDESNNPSPISNVATLTVTSVSEEETELLYSTPSLHGYPNPFNSSTVLAYTVPTVGHVLVTVYDILGRHVNTVADQRHTTGAYRTIWDGRDAGGHEVASGIYFGRVIIGDLTESCKLVLIR